MSKKIKKKSMCDFSQKEKVFCFFTTRDECASQSKRGTQYIFWSA